MNYVKTTEKNIRLLVVFGLTIGLLTFFQQASFGYSTANKELVQCFATYEKQFPVKLVACVKNAINHGANPDVSITDNGSTPLMYAIINHYDKEIIALLINRSKDIDKQNKKGITALMLAAEDNKLSTVKLLLEKNTNPNLQKDIDGATALMLASENGHTNVVIELLDKGADANLQKNDGTTPLMLAMHNKHHDIVSKLLSTGAEPWANQLRLFYNLRFFVDSYGDKSPKFKSLLNKTDGHCSGLAKMWLYSKWASANNIKPYDNKWFVTTTEAIASWDGNIQLENNTVQNFDDFLSRVTLFQNSEYHDLTIPQTDFTTLLAKSGLPMGGGKFDKEYTIASTITLNQLINLLEQVVYDHKLLLIESLEPQAHAVALYKDRHNYYYYDANTPNGEIIASSVDEIAEQIFRSFDFKKIAYPAIGFTAYYLATDYDYGGPDSFFAVSTAFDVSPNFLLNNNIIHAKQYLSQAEIFNSINPWINESVFFPASYIGCSNSVEYFLHRNVSSNVVSETNKNVPIIIAAEQNHFDTLKKYLQYNMDPNLQAINGKTALMVASEWGFIDIVKLLLIEGANPNLQRNDETTALMLALSKAPSNHHDVVIELLNGGADPNLRDGNGITALMIAIYMEDINAVSQLLKKGANPNLTVKNGNGETMLMQSLFSDHPKIAIVLLDGGADFNLQRTTDGATALMIAAQKGHVDVVGKLLEKCADTALTAKINGNSYTASDLAREEGYTDIKTMIDNAVLCSSQ
jgi:ankyrin repeat protein